MIVQAYKDQPTQRYCGTVLSLIPRFPQCLYSSLRWPSMLMFQLAHHLYQSILFALILEILPNIAMPTAAVIKAAAHFGFDSAGPQTLR